MLRGKKSSLILAALLLGFGAGIKYLSFYNLSIVALFFLFKIISERKNVRENLKSALIFFVFWFVVAGFWYVKNLIVHGNPVYPFFESLSVNFKDVYPRTLPGFLAVPFKVFAEPHYLTVFLGFLALPFIVIFRKSKLILENKKIIFFFLIYIFLFFAIWFFVGAQVRRYTFDGQVILIILFSIIFGLFVSKILEKISLKWLLTISGFFLAFFVFLVARQENNFLVETIKLEAQYLSGSKTDYDFYQFQNLGEEFAVSKYINNNLKGEKIVNNLCPKEGNFFLKKNNFFWPFLKYIDAKTETDLIIDNSKDVWPQVSSYLEKNDVNYFLYDWEIKEKFYK